MSVKAIRKKKRKNWDWFDYCNVVFMVLFALIMLYPYWNQVVLSFNDGVDSMFGGVYIWPRKFTLANYRVLFGNKDIWRAVLLTATNVVCYTSSNLIVTTAAAYTISKKKLPFRNFFVWYYLLPGYIPGTIIATFILFRYLGLFNNQLVYWVPYLFSFYNMIILRTYIQGLPESVEEAAIIDGASEMTVFIRIILPMCKPVLATIALWLIVGSWNNYQTSLYYINDKRLYTLQYLIMQIIKRNDLMAELARESMMSGGNGEVQNAPTTEAMKSAAIIFSTAPVVAAYPFLQKYFVKGVTVGAIKE